MNKPIMGGGRMSDIIKTWAEIAAYFGVSEKTVRRRKAELEEEGDIFEMLEGRPPRRVICSYPSMLQHFVIKKGKL